MVSNNEAANALVKLKTSKKPKAKPGPKPKTPSANKPNSMNKIATALIANRSNKPKNNNQKKAARNFLQSVFTPRKNVKK
jgi:hypothetical protein|tara:strand:+ start:2451 stop:2690 length:240 start_codon:yes stop_codon:yes gene_type:complete